MNVDARNLFTEGGNETPHEKKFKGLIDELGEKYKANDFILKHKGIRELYSLSIIDDIPRLKIHELPGMGEDVRQDIIAAFQKAFQTKQ